MAWQPAAYYSGRRGPVLNHATISRLAGLLRAAKAVHPSQSVPASYLFDTQDVIKDRSNFNKTLTNTPGFVKTYQAGVVGWYFDERLMYMAREQGQEVYPLNTSKIPDDLPTEVVWTLVGTNVATPEDTAQTNRPWFDLADPIPVTEDANKFAEELMQAILVFADEQSINASNIAALSEIGYKIARVLKTMKNPEDI